MRSSIPHGFTWFGRANACRVGALTGCPAATSPSTSPPTAEDFYERVEDAYVRAFCEETYGCPLAENPDTLTFVSRFGSVQGCREALSGQYGGVGLEEVQTSLDAGRIVYDAEQAAKCLDALDTYLASKDPCEPFNNLELEECGGVVEGQLAVGANCTDDGDCVGDSTCSNVPDQCYGTCQESGECGDVVCAASEYCEESIGAGECRPKRALGEACTSDAECVASSAYSGCLKPSPEADEGVCTRYRSVHAEGFCGGEDSYCIHTHTCGGDQTCAPLAPSRTFVERGGACDPVENQCELGIVCTDWSEPRTPPSSPILGLLFVVCVTYARCDTLKESQTGGSHERRDTPQKGHPRVGHPHAHRVPESARLTWARADGGRRAWAHRTGPHQRWGRRGAW